MFCMGLWLMGTVLMALVAMENFYTIDRLMQAPSNPTFATNIEKLGHDATRDLLRYSSSELNRLYFQVWNLAQLAIGLLALWLTVKIPAPFRAKWGIVAMLAIDIFLAVASTPRILPVGRGLHVVSGTPPPDGLVTF